VRDGESGVQFWLGTRVVDPFRTFLGELRLSNESDEFLCAIRIARVQASERNFCGICRHSNITVDVRYIAERAARQHVQRGLAVGLHLELLLRLAEQEPEPSLESLKTRIRLVRAVGLLLTPVVTPYSREIHDSVQEDHLILTHDLSRGGLLLGGALAMRQHGFQQRSDCLRRSRLFDAPSVERIKTGSKVLVECYGKNLAHLLPVVP